MQKKVSQYLRLGILVFAGVFFMLFSIYIIGKQQNMFRPVVKISTIFADVKGLELGNNVRFLGINVGTVSKIELQNETTVFVEMSIDRELVKYIRKDARVEISNDGLMGNNILVIYPGEGNSDVATEGDRLLSKTSITTDELLTEAKNILQNTKEITTNLIEISDKMNNGNGDFSKLLNEDRLSKTIDSISLRVIQLANEIDRITYKMNKGDGDIARLLNEDNLTQGADAILNKIDSISVLARDAVENLYEVSVELRGGNGVAHKLVYDTIMAQKLDTTMFKVNEGIDEATKAVNAVQNSWILNVFSKKKKDKE